MTSRKLWTATVPSNGGTIYAQCKGSLHELMTRLRADDPVWHKPSVSIEYRKRLPKHEFERGIAIDWERSPMRCTGLQTALTFDGWDARFDQGGSVVKQSITRLSVTSHPQGLAHGAVAGFIHAMRAAERDLHLLHWGHPLDGNWGMRQGPPTDEELGICSDVMMAFVLHVIKTNGMPGAFTTIDAGKNERVRRAFARVMAAANG